MRRRDKRRGGEGGREERRGKREGRGEEREGEERSEGKRGEEGRGEEGRKGEERCGHTEVVAVQWTCVELQLQFGYLTSHSGSRIPSGRVR